MRSAVYHLKKDGASLEFILFPMIHAGSDEILLQDESFEKLDALLIDERDRKLITHIQNLYDSYQQDKKVVGAVYGARHMRNAISFLLGRLNYRVAGADWVTVFDL